MPATARTPDLVQRIRRLEADVAALRRAGWERDELPLYPTSLHGLVYEDATSFTTYWETIFTPRTSRLDIGMVFIGDQVSATNTGGGWQILLDGTTVVASGTIAPLFSFVFPTASIDLTPYRASTQLKVQVQARRTSGATTGGKYGTGGTIGGSITYARLL
ncbi:hypothetical protein [Streptomyces longwoodensis]|uniref:hypothetical protein n=1 Tax=Streptomyces longwoodensis TaxID=68231 RepID=UPI002250D5C0|nr:hypothetical protein [Streptomyces longwoodensis]MCX4994251.1 hypothetical protein [Streptomyces longwoodensis]